MNSYNKFSRSGSSKLGREIIQSGGLTPTMQRGVMTAIPIWELLGLTEEKYQLDLEYKAFVENEKALTEIVKEAFDKRDASMNIAEVAE